MPGHPEKICLVREGVDVWTSHDELVRELEREMTEKKTMRFSRRTDEPQREE